MSSLLDRGVRYGLYLRDQHGNWAQDGELEFNKLPTEFVRHVAGLIRGSGATPISNWYMFLFENNYVPTDGVTAADLPGVVGECTAYSESARPSWDHQFDETSVIDNGASLATFTMTASKRIYGAGIVSNNVKAGNTGMIMSIARFATPRDLEAGQEFGLGGVLTLIPTNL